MRKFPVLLIAGLLAFAAGATDAAAQVLVAPPVVSLSEREPFGSFIVRNQSEQPQEVTIDFRFGYPVTDSLGTMSMTYGDTLPAAGRSATSWVRAFPRQFTLAPGQQQSVRILGRADASSEDGTYWTRITTLSTPLSVPADTIATGVTANVIFRLEQVTTLLLRKGDARTTVEIGDVRVVDDSANLGIIVPLRLGGNSPFLGRIGATVRDAGGAVTAQDHEFFAMYVDMTKRFIVPRTALPAGEYTVELVVTSDRDDLPPGSLLQIEPVRHSFRIVLP